MNDQITNFFTAQQKLLEYFGLNSRDVRKQRDIDVEKVQKLVISDQTNHEWVIKIDEDGDYYIDIVHNYENIIEDQVFISSLFIGDKDDLYKHIFYKPEYTAIYYQTSTDSIFPETETRFLFIFDTNKNLKNE